jgi:hypothetical protein
VSGLATEAEMSIKEIQDMIAEDMQKSEEFEVLLLFYFILFLC